MSTAVIGETMVSLLPVKMVPGNNMLIGIVKGKEFIKENTVEVEGGNSNTHIHTHTHRRVLIGPPFCEMENQNDS